MTFQLDPDKVLVGRPAGHLEGRQVLARDAGLGGRHLLRLHRRDHEHQDARRRDSRDHDEGARRPDRRRPLRLHPPRAHLGEGVDRRPDRVASSPSCRWSARGRTSSPSSAGGGSSRMEPNPEWRGEAPNFDEIQYIKYGNQDARRARAYARRGRHGRRGRGLDLRADRRRAEHRDEVEPQPSLSPQLAFNLCPEDGVPGRGVQPGVQELEVRQAIAYGIDRERINAIAAKDTSFVANSILPTWYSAPSTPSPRADLPVRPGAGQPDPRRRRVGVER